MIEFDCPHCAGHIRVKDDTAAGKQGKCNHCGESITVPETLESSATDRTTPTQTAVMDEVEETPKERQQEGESLQAAADAVATNWKLAFYSVAGISLIILFLSAKSSSMVRVPSVHFPRFKTDYADPAAANALESIEAQVKWIAENGTTDLQWWLIILSMLIVLQIVQSQRVIYAIRENVVRASAESHICNEASR